MKSLLMMTLLSLLTTSICASPENSKVQLFLEVVGSIEIDPEGKVHDYAIETELTPALASIADAEVRRWRFEPIIVKDRPVFARTRMHWTMVAARIGASDRYQVQMKDVDFGAPKQTIDASEEKHRLRYPKEALRQGVGARVLLSVRTDENGRVVDLHPYQISLSGGVSERAARRWRGVFQREVISTVKHWTFDLGETIDERRMPSTFMMPVEFRIAKDGKRSAPSVWHAYVPGPVVPASWMDESQDSHRFDALEDGQALALSSRFRFAAGDAAESQ